MTAKDLTEETDTALASHVIFMGCGSRLNALDVPHPAKEYPSQIPLRMRFANRLKNKQESGWHTQENAPMAKPNIEDKQNDICNRLGAVDLIPKNNWLRITPSRGYKFEPGFFKNKLSWIKDWVNAAIKGASRVRFPELLDVAIEVENPRDGDQFEMIWVKFDGCRNLWDLNL